MGCQAPEERSIGSVVSGAIEGGAAGVAGLAGELWGKAREGMKAKFGKEAASLSPPIHGRPMSESDGVCWHSSGLADRRLSAPPSSISRDDDWESLFSKKTEPARTKF